MRVNEFHKRREINFLCDFLRGVMVYNSPSAEHTHEVCLLFKDVEKMTRDLHGLK